MALSEKNASRYRIAHYLQERNGSSLQAITKDVGDKHPALPGPWKKLLSNHVRKLKLAGKLVQVTPKLHSQAYCLF